MILLSCSCLNVHVHCRGKDLELQDVSELNLPKVVQDDVFFSTKLYKCPLDLAGVTMSQERLCKERILENWSIKTCVCCMMDVYAIQSDVDDLVFVSIKVQTNSEISNLMESEKYSPLFRIVLPEINDNFIQNIGLELHNGNVEQSIEIVQNRVSNYLKEEQKAMEIRIKQFTEQQQQRYENLLQQARKHKQVMIYLLLKSKEGEKDSIKRSEEPSIASLGVLNKDNANDSSFSTDSAFDRTETSELPVSEPGLKENVRMLRRTMSNPSRDKTKRKAAFKRTPASFDVGGVFDMEEFDLHGESFVASDEESEDSESGISVDVSNEKPEVSCYGTSLPVTIPSLSHMTRYSSVQEDEIESPSKGPVDIAASIKALACSVRDGTEMFGELPRRRLNTGELLSSRPA